MQKIISALEQLDRRMTPCRKYLDPVVACLLACIPFLQHYKGLVDNAATTVLVLLLPYLGLRLLGSLPSFRFKNLRFAVVLMAFFLFKIVNHGTRFMEIAQAGIMCFYLLCLCQDCIDTAMVKKAAIFISVLSGVLLIAQHLCFNFLHFHLQLVPVSALLPESDPWVLSVQTGTYGINGIVNKFYRPSAFFLEPSHLFLYGFPMLFLTLFHPENRHKNIAAAAMISLAMILSSSGMGVLVVFGAWGLFFGFRDTEPGVYRFLNIFRKRNLIQTVCFVALFVSAVVFIPFVQNSVIRIFVSDGGSTAIEGRTEVALLTLESALEAALEAAEGGSKLALVMLGVEDITGMFGHNMPGFMSTWYAHGLIGLILSYELYVKGLVMLKMPYLWFSVILLVVSFFSAHTHGTFFMLYFVMLLRDGYHTSMRSREETLQNISRFLYGKQTGDPER